MDETNPSRMQNYIVGIMSIVILGFCMFGFGSKFIELVYMVLDYDSSASTEGVFAVAPLSNYLLASAGFLCMLGWAASQGMFRDIERPKQTMLDIEEELDAASGDAHYSDSILQ
ncbi:hypothetical protein [Bythopirellula polymerisocia]|uniref:Uncharacterized protein n=1 Tax=Bythopirellula polymerisocia TaxID=2528003 RepID=A0A5C6CZE1_9BACT|nr:hypothetical protein [Bythopirellula polymerisocia]TWU29798.1 hypothetical protein Pla144_05770 [Bythopirellula polymerisocia]